MKKKLQLLLFLLFVLPSLKAVAQSGPYGNEWINYSQQYFKIKVGGSGMCRVYVSELIKSGFPLPTVFGSNLMLFRDGKEVPIYVSAEVIQSGDYIEFWADGPNGNVDRELYLKPEYQPNPNLSLFNDTACYFLTFDHSSNHLRYAATPNNIPNTPPAAEPYCLATTQYSATTTWLAGPSYAAPVDLWSSSFDAGEGYVNGAYNASGTPTVSLNAPNLVAGVDATLSATVVVRSFDFQHQVKLFVNSNQLADSTLGVVEARKFDVRVPASTLSAVNQLKFTNQSFAPSGSSSSYDVYGIATATLEYPRNLDMSGVQQGRFRLAATGASQYIEFSNLGAARLYDLTNRKWYQGNTDVAGKTRFYLEPSAGTRDFVLLSDAATNVPALTVGGIFQFHDWSQTQADYLIISHPDLGAQTNGHYYVREYADYRKSSQGGGHTVQVANVTDLYDEFAYGSEMNPLAIKHFLNYAYDTWTTRPKDVFLIGRGIFYNQRQAYAANRTAYSFPVVPTYGIPGSDVDFVMFGNVHSPKIRIGRLPVWSPSEIGDYLNKVEATEQLMAPAAQPSLATEMWKKRVMHLIGTGSDDVRMIVEPAMNTGALILADSLTGRHTYTFAKASTAQVQQVDAELVDSLLRGGVSQISFYGHGSSVTLDYELPKLSTYSNGGRCGHFLALGCDVAQVFQLTQQRTISEQYVLAPNSGSLTMLASCNKSFTGFDDYYLYGIYNSMAHANYGGPIGAHANYAYDEITQDYISGSAGYPNNYSTQLESMILVGDPATSTPAPPKPDYFTAEYCLSTIPGNVSTSNDSFSLYVQTYNLGRANADTVMVKVEHTNPAGQSSVVATYLVRALNFSDTTVVRIPVNAVSDLGLNKYTVTVDANSRFDEISELNNTATLDLFIYSDNLVPVYPREFAIVHKLGVTLKASVLNAFRGPADYRLEIDTTQLFNSPVKQTTRINSRGGVVKWTPDIQYHDSTVYYWRAALDSPANNPRWTSSSFVYLANGSDGWNQSHYYQYQKDFAEGINLDSARTFSFDSVANKLEVKNIVLCWDGNCNASAADMQTFYNNDKIEQSSHSSVWNALSILVIDPKTARIWMNSATTTYGSTPPRADGTGSWSRQFNLASQAGRIAAARFLDTIPNGSYVVMKNAFWHGISSAAYLINAWKADSAVTGPGRDLYHTIYNMGFTKIDSMYRERVFIFMCRKNDPTLPVYQAVTDAPGDKLRLDYTIYAPAVSGQYRSTVIGPAKAWQSLQWKTFASDTAGFNDTSAIAVIGVSSTGAETLLMPFVTKDTSLASISATQYPKLRLLWLGKDSVSLTSPQMAYWRVLYQPVPEAALNPVAYFAITDSVAPGQIQHFGSAIENLTDIPMDSMLVRYRLIAANGASHTLSDVRYRPLGASDTLHADFNFDATAYPGSNLLFVEANPDDDQPEQYHPNNLAYLPFRVGKDTRNPLLDVTFDGVHILNGDLVSARPLIKVSLKDESRYRNLDDTSLLRISLVSPNDSISGDAQPIYFDGVQCRFIPASSDESSNTAYIEYRPQFIQDGTYQLIVSGRDKAGNLAGGTSGNLGTADYRISFTVENKASITHLLNYPNPFSTSTAFVFTLTGWQIPSQLKIQILTVTGKVVREITRAELGPLHIGRNITEYKWDGRDQYGQLLGNGVYLYRVVTSLNGQDMDLREDSPEAVRRGGGIDRFFHNGWGKMYIMR